MKINELLSEYITDPKINKKLGSYNIKPDPAVKDKQLPNYHKQYPGPKSGLADLSRETRPEVIERAKTFFDKFTKSVPSGYPHWVQTERGQGDKRKLEYTGHTRTDNKIGCFLTGSGSLKTFAIYINGIPDNAKKPIFDVVTGLGFVLGKSAMNNRQIAIAPKNATNVDSSLIDFWKIVEAIEGLGEDFNASDEPNSSKKLNTDLTDIGYYMGAAGLIFVATRFMSDNLPQADKLLPTSTNKGTGTFDIAPGIITKGMTKSAYQVQHGKGTPQPLTNVFAVPPDIIVSEAQKLLKKNGTGQLKITSSMKDDIIKVAEVIRKNLVLIRCTQKEKDSIESMTQMPSTWTATNGNVLARFQKLKIPVFDIKDGKGLAEDEWN